MAASSTKYQRYLRGDYVPIYMTFGAMLMSTSVGIFCGMRELLTSPNVMVNKKRRKEIPEVEEPEYVLGKSEAFLNNSIFRRLGKFSGLYEEVRRGKSLGASTINQ
ncbi:hypothetical protein KI387_011540, partial [Taxus chinensis]